MCEPSASNVDDRAKKSTHLVLKRPEGQPKKSNFQLHRQMLDGNVVVTHAAPEAGKVSSAIAGGTIGTVGSLSSSSIIVVPQHAAEIGNVPPSDQEMSNRSNTSSPLRHPIMLTSSNSNRNPSKHETSSNNTCATTSEHLGNFWSKTGIIESSSSVDSSFRTSTLDSIHIIQSVCDEASVVLIPQRPDSEGKVEKSKPHRRKYQNTMAVKPPEGYSPRNPPRNPPTRKMQPRRRNHRAVRPAVEVMVANAEAAANSVMNDAGGIALNDDFPMMRGRRIMHQIGAGAFGKVYETRNLATGRKEVMKAVTKTKTAALEALILAELPPHDNVIEQYQFLASKQSIYIFLQHGGSYNLYQVMEMEYRSRFELGLAGDLFSDVLKAINHMHENGVCHLDIKPENVMLGDDDVLRLADFGTARYLKNPLKHASGSFPYCAPEVLDTFKNKKVIKYTYQGDVADIFSLGVLLFEMCFGLNSMHVQLGWQGRTKSNLLGDPDRRAAEIRGLLFDRITICKKKVKEVEDKNDNAMVPRVIVPALHAMLAPDVASRVPLRKILVHFNYEN